MIVAYDFDGVLATGPKLTKKPWRKMNGEERRNKKLAVVEHYKVASPIIFPSEKEFHVISARKETAEIRQICLDWLTKYHGEKVLSLSLLNESRSLENVIQFKGSKLVELQADRFIEDNMAVLKGIKKAFPDLKTDLIYFDGSSFSKVR